MTQKWSNFTNSYYNEFFIEGIKINHFEKKSSSLFASVNIFAGSKEYQVNNNKSGIAHFVEHVLFNNFHATNINDLMNEGVTINGITSFDGTVYFIGSSKEEVINQGLLTSLFDITLSLNVNEEIINNEKGIISSEALEGLTSPVTKFYTETGKMFFKGTGLETEVIGEIEDIESTTLEDVIKFYDEFYATNNIEINLVGELNSLDISKIEELIKEQKEKTKNHLSSVFNNSFNVKKEIFVKNDYTGKIDIYSNKINFNFDEYLIWNNTNLEMDIYKYRLYINLMFNLLNDDFNPAFFNYISDNNYLANDFDITTINYTPDHEILLIEIKRYDHSSTKDLYLDIVDILKNTMTEELFNLMKKSKYLDSITKKDSSSSRLADDLFIHVLVTLSDQNKDFSFDYSYQNLNFEEYKQVVNSINFDKYLLSRNIIDKKNV